MLPHFTWMVDLTMNLISGTHHSCERREYAFMVLREYLIIFRKCRSRFHWWIYFINYIAHWWGDIRDCVTAHDIWILLRCGGTHWRLWLVCVFICRGLESPISTNACLLHCSVITRYIYNTLPWDCKWKCIKAWSEFPMINPYGTLDLNP